MTRSEHQLETDCAFLLTELQAVLEPIDLKYLKKAAFLLGLNLETSSNETIESVKKKLYSEKVSRRKALLQSDAFRRWWEYDCKPDNEDTLPEDMQSVLIQGVLSKLSKPEENENSQDVDTRKEAVWHNYYLFCRDMTKQAIQETFRLLVQFTQTLQSEVFKNSETVFSIYEPIVALQSIFTNAISAFYAKSCVSDSEINNFIILLRNVSNGIRLWPFGWTTPQSDAVEYIKRQLNYIIKLLKKSRYARGNFIENNTTHIIGNDDGFLIPEKVHNNAWEWLEKSQDNENVIENPLSENQSVVLKIIEIMLNKMELEKKTLKQNTTKVFTAVTTGMRDALFNSLSSVKSTSRSSRSFQEVSLLDGLAHAKQNLQVRKTVPEFLNILENLLSLACEGATSFRKEFITKILNQAAREYYAETVLLQFNPNPLSKEEVSLIFNTVKTEILEPVPNEVIEAVVPLFLRKLSKKVNMADNRQPPRATQPS